MYVRYKYHIRGKISVIKFARKYLANLVRRFLDGPACEVRTDIGHVFIIGSGHSGTTLLASRLGKHGDFVLIGEETRVFFPKYGNIVPFRVLRSWNYFAAAMNKRFVIEKTPKHVHCVERIMAFIPRAKFIAIVRNPLDVVASLYKRSGDFDSAVYRWLIDNRAVLDAQDKNIKTVRFEDLTERPEEILKECVRYIGCSWDDRIMQDGASAYDVIPQAGNMSVRRAQVSMPISRNVGKWRDNLSADQVRCVISKCDSTAKLLGYDIRAIVASDS